MQIFFTSPLTIFFSTHNPVYMVSPTCNGHLGSGTDGSSCAIRRNKIRANKREMVDGLHGG